MTNLSTRGRSGDVGRADWPASRSIAVAEYIDWFNHRRLHGELGPIPPAEHEDDFYRRNTAATTVATSVPSLR